MDIYELINDNNINILKSVHKIKNYDYMNYNDILDDVKENLINLYSVSNTPLSAFIKVTLLI